jgi:hypothetical protein
LQAFEYSLDTSERNRSNNSIVEPTRCSRNTTVGSPDSCESQSSASVTKQKTLAQPKSNPPSSTASSKLRLDNYQQEPSDQPSSFTSDSSSSESSYSTVNPTISSKTASVKSNEQSQRSGGQNISEPQSSISFAVQKKSRAQPKTNQLSASSSNFDLPHRFTRTQIRNNHPPPSCVVANSVAQPSQPTSRSNAKESESHPIPWKGIRKSSNALKRNQKAIKCLEKESESHPMP